MAPGCGSRERSDTRPSWRRTLVGAWDCGWSMPASARVGLWPRFSNRRPRCRRPSRLDATIDIERLGPVHCRVRVTVSAGEVDAMFQRFYAAGGDPMADDLLRSVLA